MKLGKLSVVTSLLLVNIVSQSVLADISGTVFRDYNVNSQKEVKELGTGGITVNAYDDAGAVTTEITDSSGVFSLGTAGGSYRIEVDLPSYLKSTANTGSGGSSAVKPTTFKASDGDSGLLIGLSNPAEYTGNNPSVITNFHVNGALTGNTNSVLKILPQFKVTSENDQNSNVTDIAQAQDLGATWGLAYDRSNKVVYASAFLRRHVDIGLQGLGGIYKIDINDPANPVISNFVTVANVGSIPTNRNLLADVTEPNHDPVFDEVGRMGLGDLDISEDGLKLYTVNLNTNQLIEIDIADPTSQVAHNIGNPFAACTNVASFAVSIHDGDVYVGSVCATDVSTGAAVVKFDGTNFTTIHTMPLNFRGETGIGWRSPTDDRWNNWITNPTIFFNDPTSPDSPFGAGDRHPHFAQPILSDIEFLEDGSLLLGFGDRSSYQTGRKNYAVRSNDTFLFNYQASGDMNKVCKVNGSFFNEGTVECPYSTDDTLVNGVLRTENTELFLGDEWYNNATNANHQETFLGGIAYALGEGHAISTSYDALKEGDFFTSGLIWSDTSTALRTGAKNLVGGTGSADAITYMAKAGGIGDVELLSDPAPIEIGNYVWDDADSDGVQDPDEAAIAGVVVKLYEGVSEVGSATTNADGYYYFGGLLDTNMTISLKYATAYQVRIDLADAALGTKTPTQQNVGTANQRDSDGDNGTLNVGFSTIAYTTGSAGENDHQQDFGFRDAPACSITASAVVSTCTNGGNDSDTSNDTYTVSLTVTGQNTSTNFDYLSVPAGISGTGIAFTASPFTTPAITIESTASPLTLTVTDSVDNTCAVVITPDIAEPATCSNAATGNLTITKTVSGGVDPQNFSLQLDCSDDSFDDNTITLASGATHTVNSIPVGTTCSVTETPPSAPNGFTYGAAIITPTVTIGDGTTVTVTVENPLVVSAVCSVTPTVTTACDDAGTSSDPSDDTFSYTINTSGSNIGASYSVSGDDTQNTLSYNTDNTFSGFAINGGSNLSLTATDVDDNTCSSSATATVPATCSNVVVAPVVDLEITKSVSPTTAVSGDTVTYTLIVRNTSGTNATGVVVSDPLPTGVSYVSDDGGAATSENSGTVTWSLGNLNANLSVTLNITTTVD